MNKLKITIQKIKTLVTSPIRMLVLILYTALGFKVINLMQEKIIFKVELHNKFTKPTLIILIALILLIIFIESSNLLSMPLNLKRINKGLESVGIKNKNNEIPILLSKKVINKEYKEYQYTFLVNGISLEEFKNKQNNLETVLKEKILDIKQGSKIDEVLILTSKSKKEKELIWKEEFLSDKDFELILGKTPTDKIRINLKKTPHILIGGATGSGKTTLFKSLIEQCDKKQAKVLLVDFKGGIDFNQKFKSNIVLNIDELKFNLELACSILEERKELMQALDLDNIDKFPKEKNMIRHIIAIDEISEVLDKTGKTKREKEIILEVEKYLSTIARQGRAFGIHLILSTQRPDSTILSGQIKSNISYRICGIADSILSSIILDNTDASTIIEKDKPGYFINQDKEKFKGYILEK